MQLTKTILPIHAIFMENFDVRSQSSETRVQFWSRNRVHHVLHQPYKYA
jgi:hypothetical protein